MHAHLCLKKKKKKKRTHTSSPPIPPFTTSSPSHIAPPPTHGSPPASGPSASLPSQLRRLRDPPIQPTPSSPRAPSLLSRNPSLLQPPTVADSGDIRWPWPARSTLRGLLPPLRRLLRPDPSLPASSARPQPLPPCLGFRARGRHRRRCGSGVPSCSSPTPTAPLRAAAAALLAGRGGVRGRCFFGVVLFADDEALRGDGSTAPSSSDLLLPAPWSKFLHENQKENIEAWELAGQSVHIGRLDVLEASVLSIYLTVWASANISLHLGKTENAQKLHDGITL